MNQSQIKELVDDYITESPEADVDTTKPFRGKQKELEELLTDFAIYCDAVQDPWKPLEDYLEEANISEAFLDDFNDLKVAVAEAEEASKSK